MTYFQTLAASLLLSAAPLAATAEQFESPQDALESLVAALESGTAESMIAVLGPDAKGLVRDDAATDREENWALIAEAYREGYRFVPVAEDRVAIEMGKDDWAFPIELVRTEDGWHFDVETGREEIIARLIGLNELDVIDVMKAYVEIQREFRQVDHDGDGVLEFASSLISSGEERDGLYWPGGDSPVGDAAARASLDGFSEGGTDAAAEPFFGYYFRLLNAQGPAAPGGAMDYMVNGNQLAGHALLAVPAVYGETGTFSFLVGENGVIYEADLGEGTLEVAVGITTYDPGSDWSAME